MTKAEASKQLNIGYILFIAGMLLGILIHQKVGKNVFTSGFMFGYFFWATYWGYKIAYSKFASFFNTPVDIESKNIIDYFFKSIFFKYTAEFFKFWICYFVGALGGGVIKQIQLSKIAYF
jgi:hypothetical protein